MKKRAILWTIGSIAIVVVAAWGPMMSRNVEHAKYTIVETDNALEIRDYAPHIVAEVTVLGERKEAINQGFRLIADYIFGNNTVSRNIAPNPSMVQQTHEKIPMTAPVLQQKQGTAWSVRFIMPARYTLASIPKPHNTAVTLHEISSKRYAAIRFSGTASDETLKEKVDELNTLIANKKLLALSVPTFAFYNPPWTLPFFRRNEVMMEIAQ